MKRLLSLVLLLGTCVGMGHLKAQNVQVLYDTGRNCVTSTVEMFRPDSFGSTYFFTDIDYNPNACGAYWEIAREFCFWQDSKLAWLSARRRLNTRSQDTKKLFPSTSPIIVSPRICVCRPSPCRSSRVPALGGGG